MSPKIGHGASVRRGEGVVVKGCGMHEVEAGQRGLSGQDNNRHLRDSTPEGLNGKYFENQRQRILHSKHELMCCGCVQRCDTDEPLVVAMNNTVPPTVQSVSQYGG